MKKNLRTDYKSSLENIFDYLYNDAHLYNKRKYNIFPKIKPHLQSDL